MRTWEASLLGTAVLVLGACAPATPPSPPAPSAPASGLPAAPAAPAAPQPKYGGIVAYTATSWAETLHPHKTGSVGERRNVGSIYETLLVYDWAPPGDHRIDQNVAPWLAESWSQPNPTTYLFKLHQGVKWQDGQDFTAEDVVFTFRELMNKDNNYPMRSRLEGVTSVTAPDRFTVRVERQSPSPAFLGQIADFNMLIMPKHVVERGDDLTKVAIGTGPLKIKSFDRTRSLQHVRNENYWQAGKPYIAGMETFVNMDQSTREAAFLTKRVDIRAPASKKQMDETQARIPDVKSAIGTTDYGNSLLMQLGKPPFNDIRVRKALHLAVDRPNLLKVSDFGNGVINPAGGVGSRTGWVIPPEELSKMPGYRPDKTQDLAEAKRLLAEAGYADGLKTTTLYSASYQSTPRILEGMAAQLRAIGVDLVLQGKPTADFRKGIIEGSYETAMEFAADMTFKRQQEIMHSKGPFNKYGLNDPKLDELLDAQFTEMDLERRKRASIEMQRYLEEKLYVIPTVEVGTYQAWHPWVHDYWYNIGVSEILEAYSLAPLWLDVDQMPADRRG